MNYKGDKSSISAKHAYLRTHYGRPTHCTNDKCEKRSTIYEWCKKTESEYTSNPDDYLWMCRSCHRKYDLTPEKRLMAMKNLLSTTRKFKTKLKLEDVKVIRERVAKGHRLVDIAKDYKVDPTTIGYIRDNKLWKQ